MSAARHLLTGTAPMEQAHNLLRGLPSLDRLLGHPQTAPLLAQFKRGYVADQLRELIDGLRQALRSGQVLPPYRLTEESIIKDLERKLASESRPRMLRVVNATGTILHTNLGRALLSERAVDAVQAAARGAVNLEFDLARGKRGSREEQIESLLVTLTGAEAGTVVNNNAAAVLLGLNSIAEQREVIVSRGELIEIGGSFRIPEVMAKSGAILREVGTTNRTHARDYENAIGERTALLLKVHTSNYRVVGFTVEVSLGELVEIGRKRGIPVMEDLGSGALIDLSQFGLEREPLVSESVSMGADVITFSGDKILGGPQAGLIVGKREWIDRMNRNPLKRALRCDKLTLAALEATLRCYVQSPNAADEIPTLRAFARSLDAITALGEDLLPRLRERLGPAYDVQLIDTACQVGSGALPTEKLASKGLTVSGGGRSAEKIAQLFRSADPPVIGRIHEDRFILDLRTVDEPDLLIPNFPSTALISEIPKSEIRNPKF